MGATPLLALTIGGWPRDTLPYELLGDVLRGGADIAREAGAFVLGGHSVDDPEPKYGMVAIGEVHPNRIVTLANAQAGDVLVLTKPIGTGVLTTALKRDLASAADLADAVTSMATLRSEEHTSELQSLRHIVCRLLLEKKKRYSTRLHSRRASTR